MLPSTRTLLAGLVDYAGVFPPAKLRLGDAMRNYALHRMGRHDWFLSRFVFPAARIEEFEELLPTVQSGDDIVWPLNLRLSQNFRSEVEELKTFNSRMSGRAEVVAVEIPLLDAAQFDQAAPFIPRDLEAFVELPVNAGSERIAAIGSLGAFAKVRTGGVTPDAFPDVRALVRFLFACAKTGVPLKTTAGLHHPLRGRYRLTYDDDSPTTFMHGFLNVTIAAILIFHDRVTEREAVEVMDEGDAQAFRFEDDAIRWRDRTTSVAEIAGARSRLFRCLGSCSFEEPVNHLGVLGIL